MIDPRVIELNKVFILNTPTAYFHFNIYPLDNSWLSISSVNMTIKSLLSLDKNKTMRSNILLGAASHVALVIARYWQLYDKDANISISLATQPEYEIQLKIKSGIFASIDEYYALDIVKILKDLYSEKKTYSYLPDLDIDKSNRDNPLLLFITSAVIRQSKYGVGILSDTKSQEFKAMINLLKQQVSKECAGYFKTIHGQIDSIGLMEELYNFNLVFPPLGINEELLGSRSVGSLTEILKENAKTQDQILSMAIELTKFPEENISIAATFLLAALSSNKPSSKTRAICNAYKNKILFRKENLSLCRLILGKTPNFTDFIIKQKSYSSCLKMIESEISLGLLPLLTLEKEKIKDKNFLPLFFSISLNNINLSYEISNELYKKYPDDIDISIQTAYLNYYKNSIEKALEILNRLKSKSTDLNNDQKINILYLSSLILEKSGKSTKSILLYKSIAKTRESQNPKIIDSLSRLSYLSGLKGNLEESLKFNETILKKDSHNIRALSEKIILSYLNNSFKFEEIYFYIKDLVDLTPRYNSLSNIFAIYDPWIKEKTFYLEKLKEQKSSQLESPKL